MCILYIFSTNLDDGDMHSDSLPFNVIGDLKVSIRKDGRVRIEGVVKGPSLANADVLYEVKIREFPPPGPFSVTFYLPGPVDPRLTSLNYKLGILDGIVMKFRPSPDFPNGNH